MAVTFGSKIVSTKMDMLTELKQNLQHFVDDANEVLQLAASWLRNEEDITNSFTFTDINKMIEDKIAFLGSTDFSVVCEKATIERELSPPCLSSASTSTHQPLPARYGLISDELKTILNQVKVMQEDMTSASEKQLTMEKCVESLSDKYSKIEQEKIREIESELKSIYEKQKTLQNQEVIMESLENTIQAVKKEQSYLDRNCQLQQIKMENFEKRIQAISDAQSDIVQNYHQQHSMINDHKTENVRLQRQSQQFTNDFSDVQENIKELNMRIRDLENQSLIATQLDALKNGVKLLEANSKDLSAKFEECDLSVEEFTRKYEETFHNVSAIQEKDFKELRKFEKKISDLEMRFDVTSQEAGNMYQDVETKYEMVCQIIADRLAPLERLREILNKKLETRKDNKEKLDTICGQMSVILPKFSQLETLKQGQAIGFSVHTPWTSYLVTETPMKSVFDVIFNNGNHLDPSTGVFTVPQDGFYATSVFIQRTSFGSLSLAVVKLGCVCQKNNIGCRRCTVSDMVMEKNDRNTSLYAVVEMKAGDKLSMKCKCAAKIDFMSSQPAITSVFTCVRIG